MPRPALSHLSPLSWRAATLALSLALAACGDGVEFAIDNPTEAPLSVRLDAKAYELPAHSAHKVTLQPGRHVLEAGATGKVDFMVYNGQETSRAGGVINPALATYVSVTEDYVKKPQQRGHSFLERTIRIDGVAFKGSFAVEDKLFIQGGWNFAPRKPFPDTITLHDAQHVDTALQTKLFEKGEFIAYYEKEYAEDGYYAQNKPTLPPPAAPRPAFVNASLEVPAFADPATAAAAAQMAAACEAFNRASSAREQAQQTKAFYQAQTAFFNARNTPEQMRNVTENKKAEIFQRQANAVILQVARVL